MKGFEKLFAFMGKTWENQGKLIEAMKNEGFIIRCNWTEVISVNYPETAHTISKFDIHHTDTFEQPEDIKIDRINFYGIEKN